MLCNMYGACPVLPIAHYMNVHILFICVILLVIEVVKLIILGLKLMSWNCDGGTQTCISRQTSFLPISAG